MRLRICLFMGVVSLFLVSCGRNMGKVAEPVERISVLRYDKLLSEYVRSGSLSALQRLTVDYRSLTELLVEDVLNIGTLESDLTPVHLRNFYSDSTLIRLIDDVEDAFPDLSEVEEELTRGFRNMKRELPDMKIPLFYSQISAFNESIVLVDTLMGISLDKYMGEDYPLYKRFYYDYQCASMSPDRIAPDCLAFYLLSRYRLDFNENPYLIDRMMHSGKIHYVMQKLLEYGRAGRTLGYSEEEMRWCAENERSVWEHLCADNRLYTSDPEIIRRYMGPSSSAGIFGESAPALVGVWMGTRIVSAYMERHKEVKLKDLLANTDYHKILEQSGYMAESD